MTSQRLNPLTSIGHSADDFPDEIWSQVCCYLGRAPLKQLVLVSGRLQRIAAEQLWSAPLFADELTAVQLQQVIKRPIRTLSTSQLDIRPSANATQICSLLGKLGGQFRGVIVDGLRFKREHRFDIPQLSMTHLRIFAAHIIAIHTTAFRYFQASVFAQEITKLTFPILERVILDGGLWFTLNELKLLDRAGLPITEVHLSCFTSEFGPAEPPLYIEGTPSYPQHEYLSSLKHLRKVVIDLDLNPSQIRQLVGLPVLEVYFPAMDDFFGWSQKLQRAVFDALVELNTITKASVSNMGQFQSEHSGYNALPFVEISSESESDYESDCSCD